MMKTSAIKWSTMAGSFCTSCEVEIISKTAEFNVTTQISAPFHVTTKKSNYNVIFGTDLLWELGIQLDFQNSFIGWGDINLPTKPICCKKRTYYTIQDSKNIRKATKRIKKILDVNYKKANLKKIVNNLKYLSNEVRKHEEMFDGTLSNYTGSEY